MVYCMCFFIVRALYAGSAGMSSLRWLGSVNRRYPLFALLHVDQDFAAPGAVRLVQPVPVENVGLHGQVQVFGIPAKTKGSLRTSDAL